MPRQLLLAVAVLVLAVAAALIATDGRGAGTGRTALAIDEVRTIGFSANLQLVVECADDIEVAIGPDPAGSDLPQVTVWGTPRVGRCHPPEATVNAFELDRWAADRGLAAPTKFVDGATSQVIDISSDEPDT